MKWLLPIIIFLSFIAFLLIGLLVLFIVFFKNTYITKILVFSIINIIVFTVLMWINRNKGWKTLWFSTSFLISFVVLVLLLYYYAQGWGV